MLDIILSSLQGVFIIILIVLLGFYLAKKNWFDEKSSKLIVNLVTKVSLPIYMALGLLKNFTAEKLITMAPDLVVPILSILLAFFGGFIILKILRIRENHRGVFWTNCFIANAVFIGLPVNLALFGEESMPSAMLYYMVNTTFFWTIGVYLISKDSPDGKEIPLFSLASLKKVFSLPLFGFIVGIILVLLNVHFPKFIMITGQYIGNMTTPLSLIFIGIEISKISFKDFHFNKDLWGCLIGRFILCPLGVLLLIPFIPISDMSMKVFTMQAAMPAMTQMTVVTKMVGADSEYAASISFITILLGLAVIPVYMVIVSLL